jgi:hypothetical protein
VDLYIHSPIRVLGVVLSELSTETALSFFYLRDERVGGSVDISLQILKSVLDGAEWSALRPSCLNPMKKILRHPLEKVVPRACLGSVGKRRILCPVGNRTPGVHPIACSYTD